MKKIFTLFITLVAFSAVFAQRNTSYNSHSSNGWNTPTDNRHYNDGYNNDRPDHAVVIIQNDRRYKQNDHYNNNDRRAEIERINREYNRQINEYRNNRRLGAYERERNIQRIERERNDKVKAFGGGVLLGGILGVLLGSNL